MAIQSNFPAIRPSLLLDFANSKRLDPRITFTRASTARFYDGFTVAKAEENLLTRSQELDQSPWTVARVTITANGEIAPDGTTTGDTVVEDSTTATRSVNFSGLAVPTGQVVTCSAFFKAAGRDYAAIAVVDSATGNNGFRANFDLQLGTVVQTLSLGTGTYTASSIVSVGNGWYRCAVTGFSSGTLYVAITPSTTATPVIVNYGRESYLGNGAAAFHVWGAQLEQRSAMTAYTPTTTAPITNYIPVLQTAQAGVPRFDHNPITGESLGLLIEEQRTNLCTYSEDWSNAFWTKAATSALVNQAVAPDGTLTADRLIEDTANAGHNTSSGNITVVNGSTYTFSVYLRAAGRTAIRLSRNGGVVGSVFNLAAGTVTDAAGSTGVITNVGNGWYRCAITFAMVSTTTNMYIELQSSPGTSSYTGDGWSGAMLWGAQLELGAFATSYIPTVAATATRQADAALMTGANFTSWYDAAEGTFYAESRVFGFNLGSSNGAYSVSDGSTSNFMSSRVLASTGIQTARVQVAGTVQADMGVGSSVGTASTKHALGYRTNDFAASVNGLAAVTDASGVVPVVDRLTIGGLPASTPLNGIIRKFAYYPLRLTDAQLQAITG